MTKRLLLLGIFYVLALALPAKGQTVDMSLQPSATIGLGGTIDIQVLMAAGTNHVDTVEADLNFNAAILQVVSITPSAQFGGGGISNFDNTLGQTNIALSTTAAFETGTVVAATVRFQSVALSAGTTISFNTASPRISGASLVGAPYAGTFSSATVIVSMDTPTIPRPTSTPTAVSTPSSTPTFRSPPSCCGDFNPVDGQISSGELQACAICGVTYPAPVPTVCVPCDCNGDGLVSPTDLAQVEANATAGCGSTPTPTPPSTQTPSAPPAATRTPTPIFTARPTGTARVLDCCDCEDVCVPPTNGACPRGCTVVRNACCDCVGGGGEQPAPTRTRTPAQ